MNDDLLTQLRTYGQLVESEMTPLEVEHVGDPLVVLKPQPPKLPRKRVYALVAAAAALLIALPILMMRDQRSIRPAVGTVSSVILRPSGRSVPGLLVTLNVPDGWSNFGDWAILKNGGDPPEGMGLGVVIEANVYTDRCQWRGALLDPPVGPTVDDLAIALAEHWGSDATAPVDVMVDGFAGEHMVLSVPTDVDFADCDDGRFQSRIDTDGGMRWYQGPGQIEKLWILDVDGVRLVIGAAYFPETSPQDRAELQQIIDSIRIESE
jgi:hypothetical protein